MRVNRPIVVSFIVAYFLMFFAVVDLAHCLMLGVELGEELARGGAGRFQSAFNAKVKPEIFITLARGFGLMIILWGLWRMKKWALVAFTAALGYYLWHYLSHEVIPVKTVAILVGSGVLSWWSFYAPRKVRYEAPESHSYTGEVNRGVHEPKSAIDELIY